MPDYRPHLVTSEDHQKLPILIIDKKGALGAALADKLKEQFLIVFVSGHELEIHENLIHIPYNKRIPLIPDNAYSHMFVIFNGEKEILDMLPTFMKKAESTKSRFYFITSLSLSTEALFKRLSQHAYHHLRVAVYGEIFDNDLKEENVLNYFIYQARLNGKLVIPNNGLGRLYPIYLEDVLLAIVAYAFSVERRNSIMFLFPRHEIHELSAARIMQKINPNLKLDFKKQKKRPPPYYIPPDGEYYFQNYSIEERLRKINLTLIKETVAPEGKKKIVLPQSKSAYNSLAIFSILLGCLLIVPVLFTFIFLALGAGALQSSVKEAEALHLPEAKKQAEFARFSFASARACTDALILLDTVAGQQKKNVIQNIAVGERLSGIELDLLDAAEKIQQISENKNKDMQQDFLQALATVKYSLITLQKLRAEEQLPKPLLEKLSKAQEGMSLLENVSDAFPSLLGFEGKKSYLVLFQNNMELRPGGGFIGSYGLLKIDQGKAEPLKVFDVYDADGKLTTHVEPPYGLRRYLGAAHLFLRDSNFDPDFTRDGITAAQFLHLETVEKVDGVIAVDTTFLKNILTAFGPIDVPDYKETVTSENYYLLTQTHAEKDFFPGSTQKKDFLRALFNAMMTRLAEKKNVSYAKLIDGIIVSMKQKHLMFAVEDNTLQKIFTVNNLSGSLWDGRSKEENTFLDYFGVIDANVGINKANYYLNRAISQHATIGEQGDLQTKTTITYENTSTKDSPYGGDYKNYVRFILPKYSVLQSVKVDEQEQPTTPAILDPAIYTQKDFIPPSGLEIEETEEAGKSLMGFFLIVPAGSTKKVTITYTLSQVINTQNPAFTYSLAVFKQPGTQDDPYSFSLSYPLKYKFLEANEGGVDVGGKITFGDRLNTDKEFQARFTKK